MASYGVEDLLLHFRQRRGFGQRFTWSQRRNEETISSRCDYILGCDRRMFTNVCLRNPRLFASDHLMVLGELESDTLRRNKTYLTGR
jgi:hypothetical protein